jgi:hypothetical protein
VVAAILFFWGALKIGKRRQRRMIESYDEPASGLRKPFAPRQALIRFFARAGGNPIGSKPE